MSDVPTSFDFDGQALRPDYVIKCSYGNDSIALMQFLHEYNQKTSLGKVVVLYNDTGWAASWWENRVKNGEELADKMGFIPSRTSSIGMRELVMRKNCWPNSQMKFCTEHLKILPTMGWLSMHDPEGKSVMVCGVRREESFKRRLWPEWVESSDKNEGRADWSPLVEATTADRDELIVRAGWVPLEHRSRECRCVLANSTDLKRWGEEDVADIAAMETALGEKKLRKGESDPLGNRFMFRPSSKKGNPQGIVEVVKWAHKVGKNEELDETGSCDSGFCTG